MRTLAWMSLAAWSALGATALWLSGRHQWALVAAAGALGLLSEALETSGPEDSEDSEAGWEDLQDRARSSDQPGREWSGRDQDHP